MKKNIPNRKITKAELVELLKNWNTGARMASIQYITEPKNLTKEGKAKFDSLYHIAAVSSMLGYNYENSVNNNRERENIDTDFQSKPLWNGKGKHINSVLATHIDTNEMYLVYKYNYSMRSLYVNNSELIPSNEIKPFFKVSDNKSQGTEAKVYHRLIKLSNIRQIKLNNEKLIVIQ